MNKFLTYPCLTIFLVLLLTLVQKNSIAQHFKKQDSTSIKRFIESNRKQIHITLSQNTDNENLSQTTGQNNFHLSPNNNSTTKLSFSYQFISFSIRFIPKFIPGNNDIATKGNTISHGLGFNYNYKNWYAQFNYHKTSGFYLENSSDFIPGWQQGDKYLQLPDLQYQEYQAGFFYRSNALFSFNALLNQTERQLQSAGTWLPGISIRNYIIDNQGATAGTSSQRSNNLEGMLSAGYQYTAVINKGWFGSAGFIPAIGLLHAKITTRLPSGDIQSSEKNTVYRLRGIGGLGYQSKKWYAGCYANWNWLSYKQENSSVQNTEDKFSYQFYVGIRLKSPKMLESKTEAVKHLIEK